MKHKPSSTDPASKPDTRYGIGWMEWERTRQPKPVIGDLEEREQTHREQVQKFLRQQIRDDQPTYGVGSVIQINRIRAQERKDPALEPLVHELEESRAQKDWRRYKRAYAKLRRAQGFCKDCYKRPQTVHDQRCPGCREKHEELRTRRHAPPKKPPQRAVVVVETKGIGAGTKVKAS